jgi:hypothetical protein
LLDLALAVLDASVSELKGIGAAVIALWMKAVAAREMLANNEPAD